MKGIAIFKHHKNIKKIKRLLFIKISCYQEFIKLVFMEKEQRNDHSTQKSARE